MQRDIHKQMQYRIQRGEGRFGTGRLDGNPYSERPKWVEELAEEDISSRLFENRGIRGRKYYAILAFFVISMFFLIVDAAHIPSWVEVALSIVLTLVFFGTLAILVSDWLTWSGFDESEARTEALRERQTVLAREWEAERQNYLSYQRSRYLPKGTLEELLRTHRVWEVGSPLDPESASILVQNIRQHLPSDFFGGTSAGASTLWFACADIAELMSGISSSDSPVSSIPQRYALRDLTDQLFALITPSSGCSSSDSGIDHVGALRVIERAVAATGEALGSLQIWQDHHPAPQPQPYGVSPEGAEVWVRDWMLHMGARHAEVTQLSGDGGLDVESELFVAQVKLYHSPVPIAALRELAGVASFDPQGRSALFFTSSAYSTGGISFANTASMALFVFNLESGIVTGANDMGKRYVATGFLGGPQFPEAVGIS